jgi:hypothetical protein
MSVRILKDTEEALLREFRNILYSDQRTQTFQVLNSSFDPFTGEKIVGAPLEGHFFDSSANARNIEYPHVFIKILRSDEDLTSGRLVSPYGKEVNEPIPTATRAFDVVVSASDMIRTAGDLVTTSTIKIKSIKKNQLLRILEGPNAGTYIIKQIALNGNGPHVIQLDPKLVISMPTANYKLVTKTLTFLSPVDLNTVSAGDIFTDSASNTFSISAIDVVNNAILLNSGSRVPSISSGGFISRPGNILPTADASTYRNFMVLDPTKPIVGKGLAISSDGNTDQIKKTDWAIPLDLVFGVTVDTKNREDHVAVWNRVWEEFNPPRRGLNIVVRTQQSAESLLATNLTAASSNQIKVQDVSSFIVGQIVRIFNKISLGFETQIVGINSDTNTLMLADPMPNSFTVENGTNIISNSILRLWEWDFLSHRDNSTDGSHYWSHVYEYRVQVWVDKKDGEEIVGVIKNINVTIEDFSQNVIDSIKVP